MELKLPTGGTEPARIPRSNRTFMELKLGAYLDQQLTELVLIVPLWNWNSVKIGRRCKFSRSNRTFMELKPHREAVFSSAHHRVLIVPLWNWNKVSALTRWVSRGGLIVPLWNWNILTCNEIRRFDIVLIVPLWNWNMILTLFVMQDFLCSNRTFMELKRRSESTFRRKRGF